MPAHALEDLDSAALEYAARSAGATQATRADLRDALTRVCLPFAGRIARRYRGRGESFEDLEQVARLGLVKAIDRYDPDRGSFTAYAVITISGEIKRHFRDRTWGVHVPRRVQDLSLEVGHAASTMTGALSRAPTTAEIAAALRIPEPQVREALASAAGYAPASLNAPAGPGEGLSELGDLIGGADGDLESVDDRITVTGLLVRLPARERQMLAMRFYGNRTQAEIAAELGISQMHVSRLLARALAWLREAMLTDTPPRWEGGHAGADHHPMHVSESQDDAAVTVRVRGEVDRDTAERLRVRLRHATRRAANKVISLDLSGMPLVDAAGVAVLLDAATAAADAGVPMRIEGAQPYVSRVLAVTGLHRLLIWRDRGSHHRAAVLGPPAASACGRTRQQGSGPAGGP